MIKTFFGLFYDLVHNFINTVPCMCSSKFPFIAVQQEIKETEIKIKETRDEEMSLKGQLAVKVSSLSYKFAIGCHGNRPIRLPKFSVCLYMCGEHEFICIYHFKRIAQLAMLG